MKYTAIFSVLYSKKERALLSLLFSVPVFGMKPSYVSEGTKSLSCVHSKENQTLADLTSKGQKPDL